MYAWYPKVLASVKRSAQRLGMDLALRGQTTHGHELVEYVRKDVLGQAGAGFTSAHGGEATQAEVDAVMGCLHGAQVPGQSLADRCKAVIADVVSKRALLAWSTAGHSAVDVNVYATGQGSEAFAGNHENTDVRGKEGVEREGVNIDVFLFLFLALARSSPCQVPQH